jgi:hypothetical protein
MPSIETLGRMLAERSSTVIAAEEAGQVARADRADRARERIQRVRERRMAEAAELAEMRAEWSAVRLDPEVWDLHGRIIDRAAERVRAGDRDGADRLRDHAIRVRQTALATAREEGQQ